MSSATFATQDKPRISETEELRLLRARVKELESKYTSESIQPKPLQEWCLVTGSNWESTFLKQKLSEDIPTNDEIVASAFRQLKYELFCASVDLLGYSLTVLPNRNCIARSAYFPDDENSCFEFIYDHDKQCYDGMVWTEFTQEYESVYRYWLLEKNSITGFLSEVFMNLHSAHGNPPKRAQKKYTKSAEDY